MDTKTVYLYDSNGYYAGEYAMVASDKDENGEWIYPENSTETPMELEYKAHYIPTWDGTAWVYTENPNNPPYVPPPTPEPHEPTPEEIAEQEEAEKQQKLADLDAQYTSDKNELLLYYVDALVNDDESEQQATKDDLTALNEQYDADYTAIVEGEE
jgi:hypothetical protein